ncbi:MAG: hypothetical protein N4A49_14620 [Marinifilaceae bacterium]|jgi:hypothetical protein|nr:hypothetical protein [Marinifilaceae bacterium]
MQKLSKIYQYLGTIDKYLLKVLYRIKYKTSSTRYNLYDALVKGNTKNHSQYNKGAYAQSKRRVRNDIESLILMRELNSDGEIKDFDQDKFYRSVILSKFYYEKSNESELNRQLKTAEKLCSNKKVSYENLLLCELKNRYTLKQKSPDQRLEQLNQTLETINSLRFQLLNDIEYEKLQKYRKLSDVEIPEDKENEILTEKENQLLDVQAEKIKAWNNRDYNHAAELARSQFESIETINYIDNEFKLKLAYRMMNLNSYSGNSELNIEKLKYFKSNYQFSDHIEYKMLDVEFTSSFLSKDYKNAESVFSKLIQNNYRNKDRAKLMYYRLVLAYKNQNYSHIIQFLREDKLVNNMDDSIAINIRILEIYSLLKLKKNDLIGYKLEALRQAILRKKTIVQVRYLNTERLLHYFISVNKKPYVVWEKYELLENRYGADSLRFKQDIEGMELISIEDFLNPSFRCRSLIIENV